MAALQTILRKFIRDDNGATAIEYGLIAAMVAITALTAMTLFGGSLTGLFDYVDSRAGDAMDNAGLPPAEN